MNFKDLQSSTCQLSPERIVLDLESEVMRGLGSISTGGNTGFFLFSQSKDSDANIDIIATLFNYEKPGMNSCGLTYFIKEFHMCCYDSIYIDLLQRLTCSWLFTGVVPILRYQMTIDSCCIYDLLHFRQLLRILCHFQVNSKR